jgi:hypothetical protein
MALVVLGRLDPTTDHAPTTRPSTKPRAVTARTEVHRGREIDDSFGGLDRLIYLYLEVISA